MAHRGASQIESPQRVQALNVLKGKQQQQQRKRKLLLDPEEETPETHLEDEETKKEKETPLKRMKKMTVFPFDLIGDSTHEAAAKAGEEEHSKEIIVFQRSEKRRQQQVLRDEAAAADALQRKAARRQQITEHYAFRSSPTIATTSETATSILPPPLIRISSVLSKVQRLLEALLKRRKEINTKVPLSVEPIQTILSLPVIVDTPREDTGSSPIFCPPSLSSSSPSSLDLLVARTVDTTRDISSSSPIPIQPSLPFSRDFSTPPMSVEEMDIFEARLASLFDISPTIPTTNNETEPLILADSFLEIFESSSTINKASLPPLDLGTCLELLALFSRIPFEALQRPIIKNGFLQCCKVIEQSNMAISSHLSQAAATIDFYVNICQIAKAAEEKVLKDKEFVSHIHAEVSELKGKHSSASQFQTQLLEKKAQLEEELLAVNLALDRTATKLQITNQGLADRRQDMATTIQLFPSLRSRELILDNKDQGLYLNSTRTHLQRELRDQIVLIVKFVEETTSCNNWVTGSSNYDVAFNKIAEEGILVGLRRFRFFVFKDGGKEEKKKSPTSSIVKCYFVRMESLAPCDEIESYILSKRTVHEARCLFMHVQMVSSLAKYMARFSLILSKTTKLQDENRCVVYNEDGDPLIYTNGTGYISEDIALKTPKDFSRAKFINDENFESFLDHANCEEKSLELRGSEAHTREPPLLMQIRLVYNGRAVKGTLLVNRKLPEKTIQVMSSMIKVEADSRLSNVQTFNSLEIVGISLLRCFKPSNPWSRIYSTPNACNTKKPSELSAEELEHELFQLFRRTRFQRSYNMSVAADSWLAFVDQLLILGDSSSVEKDRMKETMHHLIDIYCEALDAPKSGKKVG
ncbi:unnamed protein product [Camellia sinensis]